MPPRDWDICLDDILSAIARIKETIGELTLEEFAADENRIDIVTLQFIKIGEAARLLPNEIEQKIPGIEWHLVVQMRNHLAHVYWGVSAAILYTTAKQDLPTMVQPIQQLLDQIDHGGESS